MKNLEQISKSTIARTRTILGFIYRPPLVKQALNNEQKRARVEFCRWVIDHKNELDNIIFSDESRFARAPDNSWRRIKHGQWNKSCFIEKTKYSHGIMVWGSIGKGFRSELMKCSGSIDAAEYINILKESNVFETCDAKYGRFRWSFMQDGSPCHNSSQTIRWLSQKAKVIPGWPPNSPDLNPIETIWVIMKKDLNHFNGGIRMFTRSFGEFGMKSMKRSSILLWKILFGDVNWSWILVVRAPLNTSLATSKKSRKRQT